jgi:hypothetical protein
MTNIEMKWQNKYKFRAAAMFLLTTCIRILGNPIVAQVDKIFPYFLEREMLL